MTPTDLLILRTLRVFMKGREEELSAHNFQHAAREHGEQVRELDREIKAREKLRELAAT